MKWLRRHFTTGSSRGSRVRAGLTWTLFHGWDHEPGWRLEAMIGRRRLQLWYLP